MTTSFAARLRLAGSVDGVTTPRYLARLLLAALVAYAATWVLGADGTESAGAAVLTAAAGTCVMQRFRWRHDSTAPPTPRASTPG